MIGGLYLGRYAFVALFALITALCLYEFLNMSLKKVKKRDRIRFGLGIMFGLTPFILATALQLGWVNIGEQFILASALLFFPFLFLAFVYELFAASDTPFINVGFIVLGMVYIGAPFALLDFIAFDGDNFYANTVFGLLLMTWLSDTGAYLVGSQIGKTKLLPRISPGKTWEGSAGGVVMTLLTAYILSLFFKELTLQNWLILGAIVSIFGPIGDLIESMLKRSVGVKDSGNLLPGHGGVLDRFDAFIFIIPFAAAYLLLVRG